MRSARFLILTILTAYVCPTLGTNHYLDDYGCEATIINGTSYYTSWSPGSITTGEGSCYSSDVDVDVGGILAGIVVAVGLLYVWGETTSSDPSEAGFVNLYSSNEKIGFTLNKLPKNVSLGISTWNPIGSSEKFFQGDQANTPYDGFAEQQQNEMELFLRYNF